MALPVIQSNTLSSVTSGTTLTVNMPATRPDGDLFICVAGKDDNPDWGSIPTNWNSIHTDTNGAAVRYHAWWWEGSSEPASYTLGQDNEAAWAIVLHITGHKDGAPIDIDASANGSGTNGTAPDVTTTVDDCLVIRAIAVDRQEVTATPATEILKGKIGTGGAPVGYGASQENKATAGSVGTAAFTHNSDQWASGTIAIAPAAGADITVNVAQASETDVAQSLTIDNSVDVAQASESDTSAAVTPDRGIVVGQAAEADTAPALAAIIKTVIVGQGQSTEIGHPIIIESTVVVGQASENDAAQTVAPGRSFPIGQASESNTAPAVSITNSVIVGQAQETDQAFSVTNPGDLLDVGQAVESDTAHSVTVDVGIVVGQAQEVDAAQSLTILKTVLVGQAVETNVAQSVTFSKSIDVGQAVEADVAQAVSIESAVVVGQAQEADQAFPVTEGAVKVIVGQAAEVDAAQVVTPVIVVAVGQASENNIAQPIALITKTAIVGQAAETDIAQPITGGNLIVGVGNGQAGKQDTFRKMHGFSGGRTFDEDVILGCTSHEPAITAKDFNGVLYQWCGFQGVVGSTLTERLQGLAELKGAEDWNGLGGFSVFKT